MWAGKAFLSVSTKPHAASLYDVLHSDKRPTAIDAEHPAAAARSCAVDAGHIAVVAERLAVKAGHRAIDAERAADDTRRPALDTLRPADDARRRALDAECRAAIAGPIAANNEYSPQSSEGRQKAVCRPKGSGCCLLIGCRIQRRGRLTGQLRGETKWRVVVGTAAYEFVGGPFGAAICIR